MLPPGARSYRWRGPFGYACLVVLGLGLALGLFAAYGHTILVHNGENDAYLQRVRTLLAGEIPVDAHRPLLYPVLAAGSAWLVGDAFLGAKLVSVLAAGALLLVTWCLAARIAGTTAAWLALMLLAGNGVFVEHATLAATDMLFAALAGGCVLAAVEVATRPRWQCLALSGVLLALAYSTRYTALALVPIVLLAACQPWRGAAQRVAVVVAATAITLLPHCWLTWWVFGRPFHNETWRSVAFRHFGGMRPEFLEHNQFTGMWSVLTHDPSHLVSNAAAEAWSLLPERLPALLQGAGPPDWSGFLLLGLLCIGVAAALRDRASRLVPLAVLCHLLLVCVTFIPAPRLLLMVLPMCAVLIAAAVLVIGQHWRTVAVPLGIAAAVAVLGHLPAGLADFAARHPHAEVAVARSLERRAPPGTSVLSSYITLGEYTGLTCFDLPAPAADEQPTAEGCFARVQRALDARRTDYVLLGTAVLGAELFAQLRSAPTPPFLLAAEATDGALLYRVERPPAWILGVRAERDASLLRIEITTVDAPLFVSLKVTSPSGQIGALVAARRAPGHHVVEADTNVEPGIWRVAPFAVDPQGRIETGRGLDLDVR